MVRALIFSSLLVATMVPALAQGTGDAAKGAEVFHRCMMCHAAEKDAGNRLGPNLFGVYGRKAGTLAGYSFSDKLKAADIVWNDETLKTWVMGPQKMVPGTRMTFVGLPNENDAEDVVAYLKTKGGLVAYAKVKN